MSEQPQPSTPSNWHSSIIVGDVDVDVGVGVGNVVAKSSFPQQIFELESMEPTRDDLETDPSEISASAIPPPPALIDSRPSNPALKKRKRSSTTEMETFGSIEKKKRDLEVRKDLTLPTAPAAGVDNVFQVGHPIIAFVLNQFQCFKDSNFVIWPELPQSC